MGAGSHSACALTTRNDLELGRSGVILFQENSNLGLGIQNFSLFWEDIRGVFRLNLSSFSMGFADGYEAEKDNDDGIGSACPSRCFDRVARAQ